MKNMEQNLQIQKQSLEKLGMLAGFIVDFLSTILNFDQVKYWLGHKNELKKKLKEVFSFVDEFSEIRKQWQEFYKTQFNWDVDFSLVIVPQKPKKGNWRLLFIARKMTCNKVFKRWKDLFECCKYNDNLDNSVSTNVRTSSSHYVIWVKDSIEPDKEFLGKSTEQADPDVKIGVTLLEGMIFELKYYSETGKHLNIKGITYCSGSRFLHCGIPSIYSDLATYRVVVYWYSPSSSFLYSGIRIVVSII